MFCVDVVDCVAAVVFKGGSHIPTIVTMGSPGATLVGFVMGNDFDARWGHGCRLEVKAAIEIFMG